MIGLADILKKFLEAYKTPPCPFVLASHVKDVLPTDKWLYEWNPARGSYLFEWAEKELKIEVFVLGEFRQDHLWILHGPGSMTGKGRSLKEALMNARNNATVGLITSKLIREQAEASLEMLDEIQVST